MSHAPVRAVAYDFDGVLVDSVDAKRQAYEDVFACYPALQERLRCARSLDVAANRVEFFTKAAREIFGAAGDDVLVERLLSELSDAMVRRVSACPAVASASALWRRWPNACNYIVSLTPQNDLRRIVAARGIDIDAERVFGSPPWSKARALAEILARQALPAAHLMVVGDSKSDAEAARDVGAQFLMVHSDLERARA